MNSEMPSRKPVNDAEHLEAFMRNLWIIQTDENLAVMAFLLEEIQVSEADPEERLREIVQELQRIVDDQERFLRLVKIIHDYKVRKINRDEEEGEKRSLAAAADATLKVTEGAIHRGSLPVDEITAVNAKYLPGWFTQYMYLRRQAE